MQTDRSFEAIALRAAARATIAPDICYRVWRQAVYADWYTHFASVPGSAAAAWFRDGRRPTLSHPSGFHKPDWRGMPT